MYKLEFLYYFYRECTYIYYIFLQLVPVICSKCHQNYCIKHRIETDHHCQGRPLTVR